MSSGMDVSVMVLSNHTLYVSRRKVAKSCPAGLKYFVAPWSNSFATHRCFAVPCVQMKIRRLHKALYVASCVDPWRRLASAATSRASTSCRTCIPAKQNEEVMAWRLFTRWVLRAKDGVKFAR
eukprot:3380650-Rhodomonas_salina.1